MRRVKSSRVGILLLLLVVVLAPTGILLAEESAPQDDENLLDNPDFEGEYVAHDDIGDVKVAPNWLPWWVEESEERQADGYGRAPSYYWTDESADPGSTKAGSMAQYWKHAYGQAAGGVYQQVEVPANSKLRFSAWVRTLTCHPVDDEHDDCVQDDGAWMGVQIAIDPNGGDNFYADSVVFLPGVDTTANDWEELSVEASVCSGTTATVFVMYHPDFPRELNKMWVDNASLTRIGDADCSGEAGGDGDGGSAPPPPSEVAFVTPQPPQADCSIVHTVSAGETLSSIVWAYYTSGYTDLTIPKVKELNNISSDIIYVGQKLTIVPAGQASGCSGGSAPAPEAEGETAEGEEEAAETEETEEAEEEEEAVPSPEPAEAPSTGDICLVLFEDANSNTLQDPGENPLAGGQLTITDSTTGTVTESYTTDGVSEPRCFSLAPADYIVTASAPAGYALVTAESLSMTVSAGSKLEPGFGVSSTGETPEEGASGEGEEGEEGTSKLPRILLGVSGLLVLAVAGGLGAYFLIFRRT